MLDMQQLCHETAPLAGTKTPYPSFANLGVAFTQLRKAVPWLQELPHAPLMYVLKCQAELGRSVLAAGAGGVFFVRGRRPCVECGRERGSQHSGFGNWGFCTTRGGGAVHLCDP